MSVHQSVCQYDGTIGATEHLEYIFGLRIQNKLDLADLAALGLGMSDMQSITPDYNNSLFCVQFVYKLKANK